MEGGLARVAIAQVAEDGGEDHVGGDEDGLKEARFRVADLVVVLDVVEDPCTFLLPTTGPLKNQVCDEPAMVYLSM